MKQKTKERSELLCSLGLDASDLTSWVDKWHAAKGNAKNKGVVFNLTFVDYVTLASNAGLSGPSQVGQSIDSFQLGRLGDVGAYSVDNCRFISHRQNLQERTTNGGTSHIAMKLLGRSKATHADVACRAEKLSKNFRLISPSGEIFTGKNLKTFCLEHNIPYGRMTQVCNGLILSTKGWTGSYESND